MNYKFSTLIIFLLLVIKVSSQEEIEIANKNEVKISYQLLLEDEGKKKDKYILIVNALNESDSNLYYAVSLTKNDEGNWVTPITPEEKGFTKIKVRNSTGIFGNGQSIIGEKTNLITTNNSVLFKVKIDNIYTYETTFKVKSSVKPLITNSYSKTLKKLEEFNLKISAEMLNGDYISTCGNIQINVSFQKSEEKGEYLIQTTNGKQFYWIRSSETTFIRENNLDYTLTFNKLNNNYTYSTSDGIVCNWDKK